MKPLFSVVGMLGGVLTGLGVLTMLQQSGTVYPTQNVTVVAAVLGLVWGILLPTLVQGRKIRKRRAAAT